MISAKFSIQKALLSKTLLLLFALSLIVTSLVALPKTAEAASGEARTACRKAEESVRKFPSECAFGFDTARAGKNYVKSCHEKYATGSKSPQQRTACLGGGNLETYAKTRPTREDVRPGEGVGTTGKYQCGSGANAVKTKFNFGCYGKGNPIVDLLFALIRFLSIGVGIVVVLAIILAGIQYTTSEGNPEQTAKAKDHIKDAIFALIFYIFIFAILQYLVPGGLFNPQ